MGFNSGFKGLSQINPFIHQVFYIFKIIVNNILVCTPSLFKRSLPLTFLTRTSYIYIYIYTVFSLKVGRILIWVIYLPRFTTCYITQLTCIYSKCWKWCSFISMHLSTRFTMFLATYLSVLSFEPVSRNFVIIFATALFTGACLPNFSKKLCL